MSQFAEYIQVAMECGALKKQIENAEAEKLHGLPYYGFERSGFAVIESALRERRLAGEDTSIRHSLEVLARDGVLAQLGMELGENGRMRVLPPPACEHRQNERNIGRDYPTCDGCRHWRRP